jgi:hypothetical protein
MPPRQNTSARKLGIFTSALLGNIHPVLTVSIRTCFAGPNTCSSPRQNPYVTIGYIDTQLPVYILRLWYLASAWLQGKRLEFLRIGICDIYAPDEEFVSIYEASDMPFRSDDASKLLPLDWYSDEIIARGVRHGINPWNLKPLVET